MKRLFGVLVLLAAMAGWLGKRARQGSAAAGDFRLAGRYGYGDD